MQFLVIDQDSEVILISHDKAETGGTLSLLQTAVEGLIEHVDADPDYLGFHADVWVNEEGIYREDFEINVLASIMTGQTLVGPAVIAQTNSDGETLGLSDEQIDTLGGRMVIRCGRGGTAYHVQQLSALRAIKRIPQDSEGLLCDSCGKDLSTRLVAAMFRGDDGKTETYCSNCTGD